MKVTLKNIVDSFLALLQSRKGQAALGFVLGSFGFDISADLQAKLIAAVVMVLMAAIALEDSAAKLRVLWRLVSTKE